MRLLFFSQLNNVILHLTNWLTSFVTTFNIKWLQHNMNLMKLVNSSGKIWIFWRTFVGQVRPESTYWTPCLEILESSERPFLGKCKKRPKIHSLPRISISRVCPLYEYISCMSSYLFLVSSTVPSEEYQETTVVFCKRTGWLDFF